MNELIKIEEKDGKRVVNARELHQFLESKTRFNDWIRERIEKFQFTEGQDFVSFTQNSVKPCGGRPTIEYALSIDMAKELCMVENNERGRTARRYFIECEKKLKEALFGSQIPQTFAEALRLAADQQEQIEQQQKQLIEQEPKVNFANAMITSTTSCLVGELTKVLTQNGYTIGQNRLFKWLRDEGYLGRWGERKNIPLQQYVEQGLFQLKKSTWPDNNGVLHTSTTVKVTGKGQEYFINKFLNNKNNK